MCVYGKFQRCFKEVLSVFQDGGVFLETFKGASQVSKKKFKGCFKAVSKTF